MCHLIDKLSNSLASKLILAVGIVLLVTIATWAFFNIRHQKEKLMESMVAEADRLATTIRLGTRYAMMLNQRNEINQIINDISRQPEIRTVRIYNKQGQIKYTNNADEVGRTSNIKAEACIICHHTDPPRSTVPLAARTRIFLSERGHRLLGIISPINNESGCSSGSCHVHPEGQKFLGALDVVISLKNTDREIRMEERGIIGLAGFIFLLTSAIIFVFVLRFVNRPIKRLIDGTRLIARGNHASKLRMPRQDELGQLAVAINRMSDEIAFSQKELNKQRDEYQNLFERVPCFITVQDRSYRLLRFNREFDKHFKPVPGDRCYHAYKGRNEKCAACPVEATFADGLSHQAEESSVDKNGSTRHWLVRTSPIRDADGRVIAAMEISLDITKRLETEQQLMQAGKLATLGEMATGVAHELNQPLSVIKTVSGFFMRKLDAAQTIAPDVLSTMLAKVDRNVDRATRIIDHMRQFARKSDMRRVRVALNDVLKSAFEIFSQQLKVRGIRLVWHLREPLPFILGDPDRLEQVFINLLLNARDAIEAQWGEQPVGGDDGAGTIRLQTDTEGPWVVCHVCDTGTGIPDQVVAKIFEPFFTTKEVGKGTGLGLSISYGIVKECGGSITVQPNRPHGTCFVLRFPSIDEASGTSASIAAAPESYHG
jgi:signal transduction histidine kinase/HAMP domain-containing protein